jgi:hypothetical protein
MMIRSLNGFALALLLAACGGSPAPAPTTPVETPSTTGTTADDTGEPTDSAASSPKPCELEILLSCGAGMVDGCVPERTTHHVCIAEGAAGGQLCEQEIALTCDEGMTDACLTSPPLAKVHICVKAP